MPRLSGEDVILYHMSTGSELNFSLEKYPCRKLMVFHNITPPRFFKGYNDAAMESAEYGMRGLLPPGRQGGRLYGRLCL